MILDVYKALEQKGALLPSPSSFVKAAKSIKALILDWDGVFTDGSKDAKGLSYFSESDAMGINLIRYSYYLFHNQPIKTFIITGEKNPTGLYLAKREHVDAFFMKIKNKVETLPILKEDFGIDPKEILFLFDDVLDLSLAEKSGARMMVSRDASPIFSSFVKKHNYADYFTAHQGGSNAIRECSELIISALENFDMVIRGRKEYSESYQSFINHRNTIETQFYSGEKSTIKPLTTAEVGSLC